MEKWKEFSVLRDSEDDEILWFETKEGAIEYVIDNFDKDRINPELLIKENKAHYFG